MSRSCHRATFSRAGTTPARTTRARPQSRSDRHGLRLCGIAEEPFCAPSAKGSSTSRTSVRARWRISVKMRSIDAATTAIAAENSAWRSRETTWEETGSAASPSAAQTEASISGGSWL